MKVCGNETDWGFCDSSERDSDSVLFRVVSEGAVGHFEHFGGANADSPGTFQCSEKVRALGTGNVVFEIQAALRYERRLRFRVMAI